MTYSPLLIGEVRTVAQHLGAAADDALLRTVGAYARRFPEHYASRTPEVRRQANRTTRRRSLDDARRAWLLAEGVSDPRKLDRCHLPITRLRMTVAADRARGILAPAPIVGAYVAEVTA